MNKYRIEQLLKQGNNKTYLVLFFLLLASCSVKKDDPCLMGNTRAEVSAEYKYKIVESIDKNIDLIFDSIARVHLFEDQLIALSYNNDNNWTITISQKQELSSVRQLTTKKTDYILFYKESPIIISPFDTSVFNQFFHILNADTLLLLTTYRNYDPEEKIVYFTEQYKENKELIPASCYYQFRIIDSKIIDFSSNYEKLFYNTREELEEISGK